MQKKTVINILHLSAAKNWGGGENHIENLCFELKDTPGIKNMIFCAEKGIFHQRLIKNNIPFVIGKLSNKMDPRFLFKLGKICEKEHIDLVHIHDTTALTLAVMADKIKKLPPFVLSKKTSFPIKNRKQTLYKYNYPKIKKILCVSQATKNISAALITDPDKLSVVYHGTRLDNKSGNAPFLLRKKFNISSNKTIIGNIANHTWPKSLETLIKTADYLINKRKHSNFHFVQIGAFSNLTPALTKKIGELHLSNHITFLGFTVDASNFMPQFDLTLMTSEIEGIPQVIYESFYHKIPVISTNVGGISEIIEHNKNGLLAEAFDYKELSRHILSLTEDRQLQEKFTSRSKEKLKNFTTKLMAEKTLAEYKRIIGQSDVIKK